jgi:peroxiredoxin
MVKTASTMLTLGTKAPDFSLTSAVDGKKVSLNDFSNKPALLVIFMCNHCPFVKHIAEGLAAFAKEYQSKGLAVVGISSNDYEAFPDDAPQKMAEEARARGYTFAYLVDADQQVAKKYRAACTPDFFLFDGQRKLVYRGQFDSSRPQSGIPVTGEDLRRAVDAVLTGQPIPVEQRPSIGCNIKWKPSQEPEYFNPAGVK